MFITSTIVTTVFYIIAVYMSYIASFILYRGIKYKLYMPTIKAGAFIIVCYISIIADVTAFHLSMYTFVAIKNGLLTLLAVGSLIYGKR